MEMNAILRNPSLGLVEKDGTPTEAAEELGVRLHKGEKGAWPVYTDNALRAVVARLSQAHGNRLEADALVCPRCGGKLLKRRNNKTGKYFLGCSNYPDCRYSQSV
ncbi:MAG: topoisomerase DNA-binding C4 zinc finger domain-containing protein [Olegusella sp.]|nr:topoisomerase DNA-binding C4 zinc finger domain-containing protein [Olegusella sp.]